MGVITRECRNCGTPALVTETLTSEPAEPLTTLAGERVKKGQKLHRCLYCGALELAGTSKPSKSAKRKKKSAGKKRPAATRTRSRGSSTAKRASRSRSRSSGTSSRRSSRPSSARPAATS